VQTALDTNIDFAYHNLDNSALFANLKKSPDPAILAWMFGQESVHSDWFTGNYDFPL
jgi:hypothetical protein